MKTRLLLISLLFVALFAVSLHKARSQADSSLLVITHASVIDGVANEPLREATVIVRDGRIENIATGVVSIPAGATVLDLKGCWLLPGFLDASDRLPLMVMK
jgi:imidazolonepropionase-like amidohydrolase